MALTIVEQAFWVQCIGLFELVQAKQPERGVWALILKARRKTESTPGLLYERALEQEFEAAKVRTYNRLKLLQECALKEAPDDSAVS